VIQRTRGIATLDGTFFAGAMDLAILNGMALDVLEHSRGKLDLVL
jgi:hypothetical protein